MERARGCPSSSLTKNLKKIRRDLPECAHAFHELREGEYFRPVADTAGKLTIRPVQVVHKPGTKTGPRTRVNVPRGKHSTPTTPRAGEVDPTSDVAGTERLINVGLPNFEIVGKDEFEEPWILACWETPTPANEHRGRVLINKDHPVIKKHVSETIRTFVGDDDQIAEEVFSVYGELAVAHVAHSERMKGILMSEKDVDEKLRSQEALTMALLGMWQVDTILLPRLAGKMTKRKVA
jgi:hypothetical protein